MNFLCLEASIPAGGGPCMPAPTCPLRAAGGADASPQTCQQWARFHPEPQRIQAGSWILSRKHNRLPGVLPQNSLHFSLPSSFLIYL
eukprot:10348_4